MSAKAKENSPQSSPVSTGTNKSENSSEAQVGLFIIIALIAAFVLMEIAGSVSLF